MTPERPQRSVRALLATGFVLLVAAIVLVAIALRSDEAPATFEMNRIEFARHWNSAVARIGSPDLNIGETTWTDREAGVFGFAFSDSMSVLGRVASDEFSDVVEIAVVGEPGLDGLTKVLDAMRIVIAVTEPETDETGRQRLLTELGVLGTDPLDPGRRATVGTTEYRVAVDAFGGVLGIGAQPIGSDR